MALWTLKGKRLAVLGLAFKGGTDDIRESPAIAVIEALLREHCDIVAYDPAAMERARHAFGAEENISFAASAYEAATDADALLILTDWEEFGALDLDRLKQQLRHPIIIDGRNMYKSEVVADHGFSYFSVGRQEAVPVATPALDTPAVPSMDETAEAA
jgi:UDPglucose 6-dehydrogenase